MTQVFFGILGASFSLFAEMAPYLLIGIAAAGLIHLVLPDTWVARRLGGPGLMPAFRAALFGVPLPLCSCGVIPAAIELRKQGASKGASAAFLVSVPETGVDSIAITWALLDPVMTVVRPVASFLTATVTGLFMNRLPEDIEPSSKDEAKEPGCG